MKTTILDALIPTLRIPDWMCIAGVLVFLIALWAVRTDIVRAHGLDKIVALSNLCFAIPLAVFGALHIAGMKLVLPAVPTYMPWRHFWAYFVGVALLLASLSIATNIKVKCSGLLFGIMMFLFVVMLEFPGALGRPGDRFGWTIVIREMAFAAGGWSLAASAMSWQHKSKLVSLSRVLIAVTAIFFSIEHFLHPLACPGVPLEKLMPDWIPGRPLIGYLTGAFLLVAGVMILMNRKSRMAATYLGAWIVLLVLFVYIPILFSALSDPGMGVKIEGINYFADTLLFAGAILTLAKATPSS